MSFGVEPFTPNNELRYSTLQFQDNFTKFSKQHSLTFGVYVEKFHAENVFYGGCCPQSAYAYNSLADFYADANGFLANANRTTVTGDPLTLPGALDQHPEPRQARAAARRLVHALGMRRTNGGCGRNLTVTGGAALRCVAGSRTRRTRMRPPTR